MATKIPSFTYSGDYRTEIIGENWYIFFLTSGTLRMNYGKTADLYLHGGGGGGSNTGYNDAGGSGGGDGWFSNHYGIHVDAGVSYEIVVGEGGAGGSPGHVDGYKGEVSSAFGYSVEGGNGGTYMSVGGTGYSGSGGNVWGSVGSGNTTYAFDSADGLIYGGCGGGGGQAGGKPYGAGGNNTLNAAANTGAGGGGRSHHDSETGAPGGKGGSGIVILRSDQDDQLPVKFGSATLTKMVFDGSEVKHLVYNGTKLFMERVRRCADWSKPKTRFVLQEA